MKSDDIPGLVFGAFLVILSCFMLFAQKKAHAALPVSTEDPGELRFLKRRIRRRIQVAGMIGIIGIMIPVGDSLINWRNAVGTFAVYWLIVIGLACWTMLLGFADIVATQSHSAVELNQLKRQQRELEIVARHLKEARNNSSTDHES